MASHCRSNALSERTVSRRRTVRESKGFPTHCDDGIVLAAVHHVYILRCGDDSLYVGETSDVVTRVLTHQAGEASAFTRQRLPVTLVYAEQHPSRLRARARERQLKRWTRAKKEALIAGDLALLKRL
jgi:putative endonuclease